MVWTPFQPLEMLFKTFSAAVFGIDAYLVEVEVDIGPGFQGCFSVVGLPDIAAKESRERIKSAVRNCGFDFPFSQIVTVNLAPADIRNRCAARFRRRSQRASAESKTSWWRQTRARRQWWKV